MGAVAGVSEGVAVGREREKEREKGGCGCDVVVWWLNIATMPAHGRRWRIVWCVREHFIIFPGFQVHISGLLGLAVFPVYYREYTYIGSCGVRVVCCFFG